MNYIHANQPGTKLAKALALSAIALACGSALATNGYFPHGYGIKAKGMGGASVAMTDNAFAGANNPAVAAWAGNRAELGLDLFMPQRSMERVTTGQPTVSATSDSTLFYVPEFGFNRTINDQMGWGVTVYGNGGMNTDYPISQGACGPGTTNVLCGTTGRLGIDMMQLIVAPTFAYKFNPDHSVGVSPLLIQQTFKADGLDLFSTMGMSSAGGSLTNNGVDTSSGFGLRLGYLGKLSDSVNVGFSYSPRVSMSKFNKYAGLFAEAGGFDIPENYALGFSAKLSPTTTVAADYQRIRYSAVPSVGNPSNNPALLGSANGPGFGWNDISVVKLGVQWAYSADLTLRAGINIGENPVQSRDVTFNILAPGVVTSHVTVGGTYGLSKDSDLSFFYMYAPSNSVSGANMLNPASTETIKMNQQSIGIQFGWKF